MPRRMRNALPVAGAILVAIITLAVSAWRSPPAMFEASAFVLDTYVQFKVVHPRAESLVAAARATMEQVEHRLNRYADDSAVARVQAGAGSWVDVDPITGQAFRLARTWSDRTDSRFDITLGRVIDLYGFGGSGRVPLQEDLADALQHSGPAAWELDAQRARVRLNNSGTMLDLGGLHKGLAVDLAAAGLREAGVKHALVDVGSNMVAIGPRPDGKPWRIGIRHPRSPGQVLATVTLQDDAISTSGDYQQTFEQNGVRYHHIIDPRTGYPARGLASVTVIAPTAAEADILSTALFVMGLAEGEAWLKANPGYEAVFVTESLEIVVTPGLQARVQVMP